MKSKGQYQIHALVGRCHLHNKKKATYSITLKMGTKVSASTQYKIPVNDELNFNTELILKIDKTLFQGPAKLSIIVTMLTEQKQKKIIGSVFANYKQKGLQTHKVSQCSCREQGCGVNVEFEVVNIQNQNNNPNNNKLQSANNSEMKDLRKTLTPSREKQLVKSSRVRQNPGTMSSAQKTQSKLNKQKIQKHLNDRVSTDLSSLTTRITPTHMKLNSQTKQLVSQLKDEIAQLQHKLKDSLYSQKSHKKQLKVLQDEIDILKKENQCLLQILKFEEEKSSAAISYITFLSKRFTQNSISQHEYSQYLQMIETIQKDNKNDVSQDIKDYKSKITQNQTFQFRPILEKEEINDQNTQRLVQQMEHYKISIQELRQKIIELQSEQTQKSSNIIYLETQISLKHKQNAQLKSQIDSLQKASNDYQYEIKFLQDKNKNLDTKIQDLEKSLTMINDIHQKATSQISKISQLHNVTIKENADIKQRLSESEGKINQLKEYQLKYQNLFKENQNSKNLHPKTPVQSEIVLRKSRFEEVEQLQNLINQMNHCPKEKHSKELLLTSRQVQQDHFLFRNKSASLLKDMQMDMDSQDPNTEETNTQVCKTSYRHKSQSPITINQKLSIPEHKKQAQKYNYEYDVDSLNYFNNFEEGHDAMELQGGDDNACEV